MPDRLTDILDGLQARLEGELRGSRAAVTHPGARGEASEEDWLRILKEHLPRRYQADRAFVIDSNGACSEQIDIVIYDYSDREQTRTIYADSGMMALNETQTDLFLTLYDGWINQIESDTPERFVRSFFDQYQIQIRGVGNELSRTEAEGGTRSDREMSLAMLHDASTDPGNSGGDRPPRDTGSGRCG